MFVLHVYFLLVSIDLLLVFQATSTCTVHVPVAYTMYDVHVHAQGSSGCFFC